MSDPFRKAATVLLIRDGESGVQVYMVQRPGRGVDFPDLHVFPGGKVDSADADVTPVGLPHAQANRLLGVERDGTAYWVAAIRECFEEAGVLLACPEDRPGELVSSTLSESLSSYRQALIGGELTMAEFCAREKLRPALDRLLYFSHWITPSGPPRRYDTRFFVTAMPHAQSTDRHTWETASSTWIEPRAALNRYDAGDWLMIMPTLTTLRSIKDYGSVAELSDAVRAESHLPTLTEQLRQEGMQDLR